MYHWDAPLRNPTNISGNKQPNYVKFIWPLYDLNVVFLNVLVYTKIYSK